ncbi:MAG: protein kinase [Anaerolineae bacterium]|nr:protein kinase [Anaerolineae bacterium]
MTTRTPLLIADRFELKTGSREALLGEGGMGAVYTGKDRQTGIPVAIKVLKSELTARDPEMLERFIREGEALRRLNHPNIVKTLGAHEENGVHYLVMEFVSGGSLRDALVKKHRLSVQQTMYIALDVADALTRAHRLDILHRDIKPDNVLLAEDGTPRLTDFGMARMGKNAVHLTQDGAVVGTLAYMAPELFEGSEADERTDIWSFGVMLFEMLTGERPYPYEQPGQLINAIMTRPLPDLEAMRPDAPTALVDLIYRMLTKERPARIPSVRLVGAELESILRGGTTTLQPVVPDSTGRFEVMTPTPQPAPVTGQFIAPHNLPVQPTLFVGRERELQEVQKLLADPATRLLTLVAPGGMGKTRLALAVATLHLVHYEDGVYFVPFNPLESDDYLANSIAENLNFTFGGGDHKQELLNYLREKQMLLILDNFENVMTCTAFIADMLQVAPGLKLLVTSRERLRLRSEQVYEIGGMTVPKRSETTPEKLAALPVVTLFLQSAHRVMPELVLDETTAPDIARICRLVDGMPLAVELAAAWLDMLPLNEIAGEIERSLDFLESNLRDVPERQRSVRAIFEASWALLTEEERDTFLRLSVFQGGFEREAATSITGASLRTLTSLINKSLLQRDPGGRYLPHRLLRQYAAERFATHPEKPAVHKAFGMYYARLVEKFEPVLTSSREQVALDAMDLELENLRAAWQFGIAHQKWDVFEKLVQPMMLYYTGRSLAHEGSESFQQLAEALLAAGQGNTLLYWRTRVRQAWMLSRMGSYEEVFQMARQACEFFQPQAQPVETAYALNVMGYARMNQGRLEEAHRYIAGSNEYVQDMLDKTVWFLSMGNLGYINYLLSNYEEARLIFESTLHTARTMDYETSGMGYSKNNLGEVLRSIGDVKGAVQLFQEAYAIFEKVGHRRGMAFTLNNLAGARFATGDYDGAAEMYERGYQLNREVGDRTGLGHSLSAMGNVANVRGDYAAARRYFEDALKIRRELGEQRGIADSMADVVSVQLNAGEDYPGALRLMNDALALYQEIGDREGMVWSLPVRAMLHYRLQRLDDARADAVQVMALAEQLNQPLALTQAYLVQAEVAASSDDQAAALAYYKRSLRLSYDTGIQGLILYALVGIAGVLVARGQDEEALRIVGLVLLYPRNFMREVETRARDLMQTLEQKLSRKFIQETLQHTHTGAINQMVEGLLAQPD